VGANDKFLTKNLNLGSAANLVKSSDAIFRGAIAKDVETSGEDIQLYLCKIDEKASKYLKEDNICGRFEICAEIKELMLKEGSLVFITGGRSVGKSKIMASIVQAIGKDQRTGDFKSEKQRAQTKVSVVLVDGRDEMNLVDALDQVAAGQAAGNVAQAVRALAMKHPQATNHTVLVLDEANLILNCSGKEAAATQRTLALFNAVVAHTKQRTMMSVVLVSPDEGLPYHLLDLGLNPDHIFSTLVISEPTPRESLDLLRNKFGVGEHLSNALVDCYGGNVYQMCKLLQGLPFKYTHPHVEINVFMGPSASISRALDAWLADGGAESEILQVLKELARTGFVPMRPGNKLARLLTRHNVCAFLTDDAVEYQVTKELRAKEAGLIPASQLMRVLIAKMVVKMQVS